MTTIQFKTRVQKFEEQGEKTGWQYLPVPAAQAVQLNPGNRKSFRVKGFIDEVPVERTALLPMGEGDFILPLNAGLRKQLGARTGDEMVLRLSRDEDVLPLHAALVGSLTLLPEAAAAFYKMPPSHQRYYSKWIAEAKTEATQARRIGNCIRAMEQKLTFGEATKL